MPARKRVLLITVSRSTRQGIYFYLESIFHNYLVIDTALTVQIDEKYPLDSYDMLLFPARTTLEAIRPLIPAGMKYLITTRIIDPVNLHKIIHIPPSSSVYLVNDAESSTEESIAYLRQMGFTQYQYIPIYPGHENFMPYINYAITVGEPDLVPPGIPTVIDIGSRIVDISTINEVVTFFSLPASLLNEITKNYIINLVKVLKLSNSQVYNSFQMQRLYTAISNNLPVGFCIYTEKEKQIKQFNHAFAHLLCLSRSHLLAANIEALFLEYDLPPDFLSGSAPGSMNFINSRKEKLQLSRKLIQQTDSENLYMITAQVLQPSAGYVADYKTELSVGQFEKERFFHFEDYLTQDVRCREMLKNAEKIALTDYNVLIQGESGTGKEVLAQAIHYASSRREKPFIHLSPVSLSRDNPEAELLGCEDSSFSGSPSRIQAGLLEMASGGTLYIDGIEHMTLRQQSILLSAIKERQLKRTVGHQRISLDLRIIAASSRDLFQEISAGTFMNELYFSLNIMSLYTIPLRSRIDDIPFILEYYLRSTLGTADFSLSDMASDEFLSFIRHYSWPGNITEVINLSRYLISIWNSQRFSITDLPEYMLKNSTCGVDFLITDLDLRILQSIDFNPKIGRTRLLRILADDFPSLTDAKLRTILSDLAQRRLIRINKTRGGCETTEYGKLMLKRQP